jgi:hypothetical protein
MKNKYQGKQNMTHLPAEYEVAELKKMMRARNLKITNLQGENKKLKGEIKECLANNEEVTTATNEWRCPPRKEYVTDQRI